MQTKNLIQLANATVIDHACGSLIYYNSWQQIFMKRSFY